MPKLSKGGVAVVSMTATLIIVMVFYIPCFMYFNREYKALEHRYMSELYLNNGLQNEVKALKAEVENLQLQIPK